jgi:4-aminobutyrate aminotransferase
VPVLRRFLARLKLTVNEEKTRVVTAQKGFDFLGVHFRKRGRGLMIGVEIVRDRFGREPDPERRERILGEAFRRGLLLLGCGKSHRCERSGIHSA